jgi:hypothetical protein
VFIRGPGAGAESLRSADHSGLSGAAIFTGCVSAKRKLLRVFWNGWRTEKDSQGEARKFSQTPTSIVSQTIEQRSGRKALSQGEGGDHSQKITHKY